MSEWHTGHGWSARGAFDDQCSSDMPVPDHVGGNRTIANFQSANHDQKLDDYGSGRTITLDGEVSYAFECTRILKNSKSSVSVANFINEGAHGYTDQLRSGLF
jgi:hypothetical protein